MTVTLTLPTEWGGLSPTQRLAEIDLLILNSAPFPSGVWRALMNLYDETEKEITVEQDLIEQMSRAAYAVEEPSETGLSAPDWDHLPEGSKDWYRRRMAAAFEVLRPRMAEPVS